MALVDRIISHVTEGVTLGVTDKSLQFFHDLQSVTFADVFGAIHSVYSHKEGPFQAVEDIIAAHHNGTLHPFATHDEAIAFSRQRGDNVTADRIGALSAPVEDTADAKTGGK